LDCETRSPESDEIHTVTIKANGRQYSTRIGACRLVDCEKQASIEAACARLGLQRLKSIKEALPPVITFEEIRLVVAPLSRQRSEEGIADAARTSSSPAGPAAADAMPLSRNSRTNITVE